MHRIAKVLQNPEVGRQWVVSLVCTSQLPLQCLAMCGVPLSHYLFPKAMDNQPEKYSKLNQWQKSQVLDAKNCYVQVYKFVVSLQMQNRKTTDKISIVPNLPNYSIVVIAGCICILPTDNQLPKPCMLLLSLL